MISDLKGQTILIISPQTWGTMFLAKHHYAIALARRGNKVLFLNPPDIKSTQFPSLVELKASELEPNLTLIEHRLFFPNWLRFKAAWLFQFLMRFHMRAILKKINTPIDLVWSFDLGNYYPFKNWGNTFNIYHPIDEPNATHSMDAAIGANVIFSVTREILAKYSRFSVPRHFIHHGVETDFFTHANPVRQTNQPIKCGLSGNLTRGDLDRPTLLRVIRENPSVQFEFWGSYEAKQSNLGGSDSTDLQEFISAIKAMPNVVLHGPVSPHVLAQELHRMDILLICYDILLDQSKGTNYHKLMEYLSTGKVIVSNNVTTYKDRPDLVCMPPERENNDALPALFKQILEHIDEYNAPDKQRVRIAFAQDNTYDRQLDRMSGFLTEITHGNR